MKKEIINSNWQFWPDESPFELVAAVPPSAKTVTLPHDAMFHEPQREDSLNKGSTGFLDGGAYKYHKTFFVPEDWKGGKVALCFEGVYRHAAVFVNQSLVGERAFGYSEFAVEIQDYLRFGGENQVLVTVKCGAQNSRWYSGAGIYRDVYLLHSPALRVLPGSLRLTTKSVNNDNAAVEITGKIENGGSFARDFTAQICIKDPEGNTAARRSFPLRLRAGQSLELRKTFYLENAALWDENHPSLYTVELAVSEDSGDVDSDTITTGIRMLTLDAKNGLRVNGTPIKLRGACLHHDQGILGAATYEDYEYRRVKRLKEAGLNAVRSAHNHASQALLNACDRLGVYVMDELSDVWNKAKVLYDYSVDFEQNWERDMESIVAADYNHPSVVLYSTGNEIFEIATEKGIETSRMLGEKFHRLDPTRFTTNGINGAFAAGDGLSEIVRDITGQEPGAGDVNVFMGAMANHMPEITRHKIVGGILEKLESTMDVLGYNYMTARYLPDAENYPDRVMVGSETYPKQIAENWDAIMKTPAVLGEFTWTGWDYLGEVASVFPNLCNTGGDISAIGVRRPVSYYREIVFGLKKGPVIAVQDPARFGCDRNFGPWQFTDCVFSYTWPGQEGKPVMVQVYAGVDEVELFQNGASLGRKKCGRSTDFVAQFDTEYRPGELTAVAYESGAEVGRCTLSTAGEPAQLRIEPELGGELIFLNIELQDGKGQRVFADSEVSISISGPAELLAFGSELAGHDRGYEKPVTRLTEGCALAVLKRIHQGEIGVGLLREGNDSHVSLLMTQA